MNDIQNQRENRNESSTDAPRSENQNPKPYGNTWTINPLNKEEANRREAQNPCTNVAAPIAKPWVKIVKLVRERERGRERERERGDWPEGRRAFTVVSSALSQVLASDVVRHRDDYDLARHGGCGGGSDDGRGAVTAAAIVTTIGDGMKETTRSRWARQWWWGWG
jgi:hypothetical protein